VIDRGRPRQVARPANRHRRVNARSNLVSAFERDVPVVIGSRRPEPHGSAGPMPIMAR
jgi:hypothetical protein